MSRYVTIASDTLAKSKAILKRIKVKDSADHWTQGDYLFEIMVNAFATNTGLEYDLGGVTKYTPPIPEAALKFCNAVYENNFEQFPLYYPQGDYRELSDNTVHTGAINDVYKEFINLAEKAEAKEQLHNVKDGTVFKSGIMKWTNQQAGETYGNIAICHVTSETTAHNLNRHQEPSTVFSMGQRDCSGVSTKIGDHRVAITNINGIWYIVDMPQREMMAPTVPPVANNFRIITPIFTPRFIEVTVKNLERNYGQDAEDAADNVKYIMNTDLKPVYKNQAHVLDSFIKKIEQEKGICLNIK